MDRKRITPNRRSIIRRIASTIVRAFCDLTAGIIEAAQFNRLLEQTKNLRSGDSLRVLRRAAGEVRSSKFKHIGCDYRRRGEALNYCTTIRFRARRDQLVNMPRSTRNRYLYKESRGLARRAAILQNARRAA